MSTYTSSEKFKRYFLVPVLFIALICVVVPAIFKWYEKQRIETLKAANKTVKANIRFWYIHNSTTLHLDYEYQIDGVRHIGQLEIPYLNGDEDHLSKAYEVYYDPSDPSDSWMDINRPVN
ncbi:hypothetical protein [Chitinophaga agri]|uniref:DUF3592 domain-containing protein n=1 Tax=Chitinophaga agri TaxID=2703787 RepID=A0A6B9ZFW4_9BACT|nr:hypothetical protein [Chitinophaga agri]QHS60956.1 hypothetical protein GWR21_15545 [Chitinophaga agri]